MNWAMSDLSLHEYEECHLPKQDYRIQRAWGTVIILALKIREGVDLVHRPPDHQRLSPLVVNLLKL
jgi:hypothetical protein